MINLVAAWWIFEGAGMLAHPSAVRAVFARETAAKRLRLSSIIGMPVGGYLILCGVIGQSR
jgi:hypothetical protein